jgi:hypothetical protein
MVTPAGRKPNRTTWTYADGSKVSPLDDAEACALFRKMIAALGLDELRLLESIIAQRRVEVLGPEMLRQAAKTGLAQASLPCEESGAP